MVFSINDSQRITYLYGSSATYNTNPVQKTNSIFDGLAANASQGYETINCGTEPVRRYGLQATYTVKKGDTLAGIVAAMKKADPSNNLLTTGHVWAINNINGSIRPGQVLKIPKMPNETKEQIIPLARQIARANGIDETLMLALIEKESEFNPRATSMAHAMGLMQIMPSVARDQNVQNPYDITSNLDAGAKHLKEFLNRFKGDVDLALAGYNWGPVNIENKLKARYNEKDISVALDKFIAEKRAVMVAANRAKQDPTKAAAEFVDNVLKAMGAPAETRNYGPKVIELQGNYSRYTQRSQTA